MNNVNMFFSYSAMAMHTPLQSIAPDCTSSNNNALSCVLQTASAIPEMEELTSDELLTQATLVTLSGESPGKLAKAISQAQPEEQTLYLALLKHYYVNRVKENEGTVLDSGSSKHLSPAVFAPDLEDRKSLSGYDNSQQWAEGNGYLPLQLQDSVTWEKVLLDVEDVDQLSNVSSQIMSMGKLLRLKYKFYFEDENDLIMVTPGGAHRVKVELGGDDIIRLPNTIRTEGICKPLPKLSSEASNVYALRRTAQAADGLLLHAVFNHCSAEKVYRTLGSTKGYKQVRLPDVHCDTCARAKAKSFGLSRKHTCPQRDSIQFVDEGGDDPVVYLLDEDLSALLTAVVQSGVGLPVANVFEPDNDPGDEADLDSAVEVEFVSPVAGRELGVQSVPRFNLYKLKPLELMFVDNKDYPCMVRGGAPTTLIFVDYNTRVKLKIDVSSKINNGHAFARMVCYLGAHKLDYPCRVMPDGCGSMQHVVTIAVKMGIDHAFVPPHQQSLNEAEKVADQMWSSARAHILHSSAPDSLFGLAVDFFIYVDMRTATTSSSDWQTPYEMLRGEQPSVVKLHRFYTQAFVMAPKSKRKALAAQGLHNTRGETGRLVGFHSPFSSTYAVMLDGNRLVHSLAVAFNDANFNVAHTVPLPVAQGPTILLPGGVQSEEANLRPTDMQIHGASSYTPQSNPLYSNSDRWSSDGWIDKSLGEFGVSPPQIESEEPWPTPPAGHAPSKYGYHDPDDDAWRHTQQALRGRPRPSYQGMHVTEAAKVFLSRITDCIESESEEQGSAIVKEAIDQLTEEGHNNSIDYGSIMCACFMLAEAATSSTKDMNWSKALRTDDRDRIIDALESEINSLEGSILEELTPDHPDYEESLRHAISGRFLLDLRKSNEYKVRGVKQGFKENKAIADDPGFVYYSHMAKLQVIRMILFRRNRGNRTLCIKDVCTAFLQCKKFPPEIRKFMKFWNPFTGKTKYHRQLGPIYGEASAPIRWEDTLAPEIEDGGLVRGENQPCVFLHELIDLVALFYVDDGLGDGGSKEDCDQFCSLMEDKFDCKDTIWIVN